MQVKKEKKIIMHTPALLRAQFSGIESDNQKITCKILYMHKTRVAHILYKSTHALTKQLADTYMACEKNKLINQSIKRKMKVAAHNPFYPSLINFKKKKKKRIIPLIHS